MYDLKLTARHVLGISLLALVVMMWVASSFLMRSIFGDDKSYDKPFLVTWLNTGTFSLYLIPWSLRALLSRSPFSSSSRRQVDRRNIDAATDEEDPARSRKNDDFSAHSPLLTVQRSSMEEEHAIGTGVRQELGPANSIRTFGSHDDTINVDAIPLTTMETAKLGCIFSMLWFAANYFGNVSLSYTNVASFTIISSLSGFFTLAMGTALGVETFTMAKLYALLVSVVGVVLVTSQDTSPDSGTKTFFTDLIIGDILALVGAALYGCYTVFLKFKVRNEERVSMTLFFGFVGVFNLVVLWPAVILLHITGLEPFELPSSRQVWLIIIANAFITFVSDYLWVLAMLMTSPLVVTVGISMSIPLALLGDHLLYHHSASILFFVGAVMVFASFIAINLSYDSDQKQATQQRRAESTSRASVDDEADED